MKEEEEDPCPHLWTHWHDEFGAHRRPYIVDPRCLKCFPERKGGDPDREELPPSHIEALLVDTNPPEWN